MLRNFLILDTVFQIKLTSCSVHTSVSHCKKLHENRSTLEGDIRDLKQYDAVEKKRRPTY